MIFNSWTISLIVGGVILVILVPSLLWIRYGKEGKKAFSIAASKDVEKQIKEIKKESKEAKFELDIFKEKLKNSSNEEKEIIDRKINKLNKMILGLDKRLKNLKNLDKEKKEQLKKITKNKAIK